MTSTVKNSQQPPDAEISAELEQFRLSWKREIDAKRTGNNPAAEATSSTGPNEASTTDEPDPRNERAVDIYRRAIVSEELGKLDEALRLYRRAFRLDADVDRIYARQEEAKIALNHPSAEAANQPGSSSGVAGVPIEPTRRANPLVASTLPNIIAQFPSSLAFRCADDPEGTNIVNATTVPLATLPDELLIVILKCLDHTSLERFASSCRKARSLSCEDSIWRDLVNATYCEPMLPNNTTLHDLVVQFKYDYRQLYICNPRIRTDGIYIATCRYVRPGFSDSAWVNVSHVITYYRFLRFLPSGKVLSLLTNEDSDRPPKDLVHSIKLDLRMKGLFIGTWTMDGKDIRIRNLTDASSKTALPVVDFEVLSQSPQNLSKPYTFLMDLSLKSMPLGKWNRLALTSYSSVDSRNGDVVALSLAKEYDATKGRDTGFWFSRVLSWGI